MDSAEKSCAAGPTPTSAQFISLSRSSPERDNSDLWQTLRRQTSAEPTAAQKPGETPQVSSMETGVTIITTLDEAPPRTRHSAPLIHSSPLSSSVRAMLETREFGRRYDIVQFDFSSIEQRLPKLECPTGPVEFLASDRSLEDLTLSVEGLLQHRKRLLAPGIARELPRKHVLVLGAGPGGLMTAIQLSLRNHHIVVCEQREVYARNRYIGVYKEVTHLMAMLGMPESMTYDFSQYRGKRGIMLADIQTFLHGVALKLGVIIYMGAVPRSLTPQVLQGGEIELQRTARAAGTAPGQAAIGMTRWQFDTISRVRSGVTIRFDTIIEATGGRSGLRELLVGKEKVVSIKSIARAAARRDPSLKSFLEDPEDHCAEYVESGYGCPAGLRQPFAATLLGGAEGEIPDEVPCFVSNIDASIFTKPMEATANSLGLASRIGDRELAIPHDWVVLECRLADQSLSRYHIEGPLPQSFEFGGKRLLTSKAIPKLNPVTLLFRILYAMGVPFDAVDRRRLIEFYTAESSYGDASDIVSTWVGTFRGLSVGGEKPIWCGLVPGSETIEYGILGEALQNAWYRFGVGVDDTFAAANIFAEGLELEPERRLAAARRWERVLTSRSVQIMYHLYEVARNTDQGVIGGVLTEHHMDEQHTEDLAEARLREVARQGAEMLAAEADIRAGGSYALAEAALEHQRDSCCRRVLALLESLAYPQQLLARAMQPMRTGQPDWRARVMATLETTLSAQDRELLAPLFAAPVIQNGHPLPAARLCQERLVELARGRYAWASPWVRACALRALDASTPAAMETLNRAANETEPLIAETAAAILRSCEMPNVRPTTTVETPSRYLTIDKVLVLREVSLFKAIPHEDLAGVASLLTERWAEPQEKIIEKGDFGDCLYIVAAGRVRIHDGERTFRILGPSEFFGELSLLDAEPRSASVSVVERTHLLRLAQADFYALMSERLDLTQAINRVLCHMVRCANAASSAAPVNQSRW